MKKYFLVTVVVLFAAVGVFAQSASDSITVTATNQGIFTFDILAGSYAFGIVNSNGAASSGGTEVLTGLDDATGSTYTSLVGTTWSVQSAPARTVRIFNASAPAVLQWGTQSSLSMSMNSALSGTTSCGLRAFNLVGDGNGTCANGELIHGFTAGNGGNSATGDLDFQLRVNDVDATGVNTWTVTLTAAGS